MDNFTNVFVAFSIGWLAAILLVVFLVLPSDSSCFDGLPDGEECALIYIREVS